MLAAVDDHRLPGGPHAQLRRQLIEARQRHGKGALDVALDVGGLVAGVDEDVRTPVEVLARPHGEDRLRAALRQEQEARQVERQRIGPACVESEADRGAEGQEHQDLGHGPDQQTGEERSSRRGHARPHDRLRRTLPKAATRISG